MKKIFTTLLISAFVFVGCTTKTPPTPTFGTSSTSPVGNSTASGKIAGFVASDVATHNSAADCWVSIDGSVYDVTSYITVHPGGADVIIKYCGKDATTAFHTMDGKGRDHPEQATAMLKDLYKGVLQ